MIRLGCTQYTVGSSSSSTDLARVMARKAVGCRSRAVKAIVADTIRASHIEEISGAIQQAISCRVAAQAFGKIGTGETSRLTSLTIFFAAIIPKHIVAFA